MGCSIERQRRYHNTNDQAGEFYNNSLKSWFHENGIVNCSTHNKGKFVVAERFIRTLENKIDKLMTTVGLLLSVIDNYSK